MMLVFYFGCLVFGFVLEFGFGCPCKRDGGPWFGPRHPRAAVMFLFSLCVSMGVVGAVFSDSMTGLIFTTLLALFHWGRWWKHESGKWKRRAAKAAGRIAFNQHGRLVIERG